MENSEPFLSSRSLEPKPPSGTNFGAETKHSPLSTRDDAELPQVASSDNIALPQSRIVSEISNQEAPSAVSESRVTVVQGSIKKPSVQAEEARNTTHPASNIPSKETQLWNPFWHRRVVLISFVILYVILLSALILLHHFAEAKNGLSTNFSTNFYTWKYGPTAVLTLVAMLWQKMSYTSKIMAPWQEMSREHGNTGKKTLLVDYISTMSIAIVFRAMKNRHWSVAAAELGRLLLIIATGFSTGLLVLSAVPMLDGHAQIHLNTTFSAEGVANQFSGRPHNSDEGIGSDLTTNLSFLDVPLRRYYGSLHGNIQYPFGTNEYMAYETFDVDQSVLESSKLTALVDGFYPNFNCKIPTIKTKLPIEYIQKSRVDPLILVSFELDGCSTSADAPYFLFNQNIAFVESGYSRTLESNWVVLNLECSTGLVPFWVLAVSEGHYQEIAYNSSISSYTYAVSIPNISMAVCSPTYSVIRSEIFIDPKMISFGTGVNPQRSHTGTTRKLDGFNDTSFLSAFESILLSSAELTFAPLAPVPSINQSDSGDPLFGLMADRNDKSSLEPFLDPEIMIKSAQGVFQGVMAQFAHEFLSKSQRQTINSTRQYAENRLLVKSLPFGVMSAAFCLLALCTGIIILSRADNVVPRNPDCIGRQAAMLTSNPVLLQLLQDTGQASDLELEGRLSNITFRAQVVSSSHGNRFSIEPQTTVQQEKLTVKEKLTCWQPFPISLHFFVLSMVIPAAVIVVLEVLQRKSANQSGISPISISVNTAHTLSTVIPAGFMILISTIFQTADSTISIFSTLVKLQSKVSPCWTPTATSAIAHLPLRNLVVGLRESDLSLSFSSMARLLGPFLTIIVAALYRILPYDRTIFTYVNATSYWTFNNSDFSDGAAGLVLGLIEQENAPFPAFTYDELVFPQFSLPKSTQNTETSIDRMTVALTAVRASLDCNFLSPEHISATYVNEGACYVTMSTHANISAACSSDQLIAKTHMPFGGSVYISGLFAPTWHEQEEFYDSCPTIGFTFGRAKVYDPAPKDIASMVCWQKLESVESIVTFVLPSMQIDDSNPPTVNESSKKTILAKAELETAYLIMDNLPIWQIPRPPNDATNYSSIYANIYPNTPSGTGYSDNSSVESFFQTLILGTPDVNPEDLIGTGSHSHFFNLTQHLYRRYMALLIGANMRKSYSPGDQVPMFATTLHDPTGLRLIQNNTSKIVLQAILGIMLICGTLAYVTLPVWKVRRSLPHNPCTIAGMMSLLAGGSICSRSIIPIGAEFMTDQQLDRVFAGHVFAMGWWSSEGGGELLIETKTPSQIDREKKKQSRFGIGIQKKPQV